MVLALPALTEIVALVAEAVTAEVLVIKTTILLRPAILTHCALPVVTVWIVILFLLQWLKAVLAALAAHILVMAVETAEHLAAPQALLHQAEVGQAVTPVTVEILSMAVREPLQLHQQAEAVGRESLALPLVLLALAVVEV